MLAYDIELYFNCLSASYLIAYLFNDRTIINELHLGLCNKTISW
jgi:hypothetical protein